MTLRQHVERDVPSGNLTYLWKITIFNWKIHYKWQCSIAMLNYQRCSERNTNSRNWMKLSSTSSFNGFVLYDGFRWRGMISDRVEYTQSLLRIWPVERNLVLCFCTKHVGFSRLRAFVFVGGLIDPANYVDCGMFKCGWWVQNFLVDQSMAMQML